MVCDGEITVEKLYNMEMHDVIQSIYWIGSFILIYILGSFKLFVWHSKEHKPCFIIVIWALIALWIAIKLCNTILTYLFFKSLIDG